MGEIKKGTNDGQKTFQGGLKEVLKTVGRKVPRGFKGGIQGGLKGVEEVLKRVSKGFERVENGCLKDS